MLSRQFVREHPEAVRDALAKKGVDADVSRILEVDEEWRELKSRGDTLRHERNEVSSKIGQLKQEGDEEAAQEAIDRSGELKAELEEVEDRADELEAELERKLLTLPMIPDDDVPVGADETENVERRREGFDDLRDLPVEVVPTTTSGRTWTSSTSSAARKCRAAASTSRRVRALASNTRSSSSCSTSTASRATSTSSRPSR